MATDGSLKFDTKINTEGFEEGISSLKDTMERLIKSVDGLSNNMIKSFTGIGSAAADSSKGVDKITDAAAEAEKALKKTQEAQGKTDKSVGTTHSTSITNAFNDSTSAGEQLVDQVDRLKEHLYYLERQGLSFGNADYDETFGALKRAETALSQYKKELVETEEALNKTREAQERAGKFTGTIHNNNVGASVAEEGYDYEKEADAILAKNRELQASLRQTSATADTEFKEAAESPGQFRSMVDLVKQSFMDIPFIIRAAAGSINNAFNGGTASGEMLVDQVDRLKEHLYYLERQGLSFGNADYDETFGALKRAEAALAQYKKGLAGTATAQKKVSSSGKKMNTTMKGTKKAAVPLTQSIFKLSNMFKLMLIRMAMRAVIQAAKEGFENLAQYSEETNKSLSILMSALTRLKNSFATAFAPILNVAAPALRDMINLLSEAATMAGQFLAALTGKSTFVKAVDVQEDYADSIKKTTEEEKDSAKEAEKSVASFDDLIILQEKSTKLNEEEYKPPTPDQMFETIEVQTDIKEFADFVKATLSDLFAPIRASWEKHGVTTTAAVKTAFQSLRNLAGDVGLSFMQVWNTEGYGLQITNDLLLTFTNLMLTVAVLADRFDEAWNSAGTGTSIMRNLGDIVLKVTGFLRAASESIKNWASTLDFGPLLKSFDGVLAKLPPIVRIVGDALLWLLDKVLLPLAKWALEKAIPAALDFLAAALETVASVINALKPLAMWLWDTFLQPLGKWAGEVIIAALKKITEALIKVSDWIRDHQGEVESITIAVAGFFAAWKFIEFVNGVKKMIDALSASGGLIEIFKKLTEKLDTTKLSYLGIAGAVGVLLSAVYEISKNWNNMSPSEKVISGLLAAAAAAAILAVSVHAIKGAWAAAAIGGAIVAGIAATSIAINAGKRSAPSSGYSPSGYSVSPYMASSYAPPRLATGTVVPPRAGEFAAILGDNRRETEIVSPLSTMKQALLEALAESGGMENNRPIQIDMIVDGQRFARAVYRANNSEKQRVGIRLVTGGI